VHLVKTSINKLTTNDTTRSKLVLASGLLAHVAEMDQFNMLSTLGAKFVEREYFGLKHFNDGIEWLSTCFSSVETPL